MAQSIDYYFSPMSPWTHLGHDRFVAIAHKHGLSVDVKPVDYGKIFPQSGGLPLAKRAPQRQKYRLVELQRWRDYLGVPLTIQPKYFPYDTLAATLLILAARREAGNDAALRLAGAILRGCWVEERNMADEAQLADILDAQRLNRTLLVQSKDAAISTEYERLTQEAIERDVFGAPSYAYKGELFWGQDRLELLDWRLKRAD
jgi:2-hydroxychromene-2-carboxylate isomerase